MARTRPNIIITGTPGVGKTSHCELLAQTTGMEHLSINKIVKERACHDGWDPEFKSWIVDDDKVGPVAEGPAQTTYMTANPASSSTPSKTRSKQAVTLLTGMHVTYSPRAGLTWWWYCAPNLRNYTTG